MEGVKMPIAPCKDCPNRELHCHSTCQKYLDFKVEMEIARKAEKEYKERLYDPSLANRKRNRTHR